MGNSWALLLLLGLGGRSEVVRILARGVVAPGGGTKATAKINLEEQEQILSLLHPRPSCTRGSALLKIQSRAEKGRKSPFAIYLALTTLPG